MTPSNRPEFVANDRSVPPQENPMSLMMLTLFVNLHTAHLTLADRARSRRDTHSDAGQATTEYALVLLAAAMVALLLIAWATTGSGAAKIGRLFDRVIDAVTSRV